LKVTDVDNKRVERVRAIIIDQKENDESIGWYNHLYFPFVSNHTSLLPS